MKRYVIFRDDQTLFLRSHFSPDWYLDLTQLEFQQAFCFISRNKWIVPKCVASD